MLIFMVALELPIISNYNKTLLISLGHDVAMLLSAMCRRVVSEQQHKDQPPYGVIGLLPENLRLD